MNKTAALPHSYEAGSQQWFEKKNFFSQDGRLRRYGCGVIAAADYCIYRGIAETPKDKAAYLDFVRSLERHFLRVVPGFGISAWLYAGFVNLLLWRYRAGGRLRGVSFFFSGKRAKERLLTIMQEQLAADCPVILILGSAPFFYKKQRGVTFYQVRGGERKAVKEHVAAHFITAAAIVEESQETMLEVYSWGERYYMSVDAYLKSARYTYPFSNRIYRTTGI
ncbi:MAG: hypothetical protein NC254_01035 [bacterium]|nr:hypothetical protein [bacterium]